MTNDRAVTFANVAPSLPGVLVVQDGSDVKEGGFFFPPFLVSAEGGSETVFTN